MFTVTFNVYSNCSVVLLYYFSLNGVFAVWLVCRLVASL